MSPEAREYFQAIKDEFGDDYLELTDAASLSKVMLWPLPPAYPGPLLFVRQGCGGGGGSRGGGAVRLVAVFVLRSFPRRPSTPPCARPCL